ncbi:MAG: preprotein translocase subunit YajC [Bradymonadales bacterium]|nr:MAG: preprotein translocase subunit YajC [Bradymonadales bacterium]
MKFSLLSLGLTLFFASEAMAQAEPAGSGYSMLIGFGLIFLIFYLFILRPQAKKARDHANLVTSLEKGDEVMTQAGVFGKIHGVAEKVVTLEVAPNVRIRVDRNSISARFSKNSEDAKSAA